LASVSLIGLVTAWLLRCDGRRHGGYGAQAQGGDSKLFEHAAPERLEASALRWRQVLRQREEREILQRRAESFQLGLDVARPGRKCLALRGVRPEQTERLAQQLPPVVFVGPAPRMHQTERVTLPELMAADGPQHAVLLLVRESSQLVAERRTDCSSAKLVLRAAREPTPERDASLDPLALVPKQPPNRTRTEFFFVAQRADHPRLIERSAGARRGIGLKQPALVLRARPRWLHQHRHHAVPSLAPARQALEAVEHLVVAVLAKSDQQREFRTRLMTAAGNARPQPFIVGLEPFERHQAHPTSDLVTTTRRGRLPRRLR
jgi:hypothetical protein